MPEKCFNQSLSRFNVSVMCLVDSELCPRIVQCRVRENRVMWSIVSAAFLIVVLFHLIQQ